MGCCLPARRRLAVTSGRRVWGPAFLRDELLPHFRLTGWTPDWYAGFPAYHFYMVVPILLVVAVDVGLAAPLLVVVLPALVAAAVVVNRRRSSGWVVRLGLLAALAVLVVPVHYGMAIKWVTVVGLVVMPVAGWATGRLAGLPFPGPALTSVATLPFLFDRSFNIMGGNLMSTMAGEFAYALAMATCLVYLGLLVRGLEPGPGGRAPAAPPARPYRPVSPARRLLRSGGFGGGPRNPPGSSGPAVAGHHRAGGRAVLGLLGAAVLVASGSSERHGVAQTHSLPFVSLGPRRLGCRLPDQRPPLQPFIVVAVVGLVLSVAFRRRLGFVLAGSALILGLAFVHLPEGRLYNGRILPAYYLSIYLLAAMGVADVLRFVGRLVDGIVRSSTGLPGRLVAGGGAVAAFLAMVVILGVPLRVLPGGSTEGNTYRWMGIESTELNLGRSWVRWNFEGYEARVGDSSGGGWEEQRALASTMEDLAAETGCGRLMWEYNSDLVRYGTPMALMLLPHWTDGCIGSMEGLYFEASTTTPYHFLVQSELSVGPSRAQRGLPYRAFDLDAGIDHLRQLGVRWYSAFSERAVREAQAHPGLTEVADSGPWTIFEVGGADAVVALDVEPAVFIDVDHEGWLDPSVEVFQQGSTAVPRTVGGPASWQRVASGNDPERRLLPAVAVTDIASGVDSVSFRVDRVGVPVLVRTSYFPNWKVDGADGPWRATPNLMVVVPTAEDVRLYYRRTTVDVVAILLSVVGLLALVGMTRRPRPMSGPALFDLAAAGPDSDRRLDRWVDRRVADAVLEESVGGPDGRSLLESPDPEAGVPS
ncbi:MAG: hypothetical protein CM1200mP26_28740 [Acidimicrobiales bacterium]|nr:MAG: hypothetical protein CM1200mP26_28740 [Acidimicrobiales bacterium]